MLLEDVKKRKAEASKVFPRSHHKLHARLIVEDASCAC